MKHKNNLIIAGIISALALAAVGTYVLLTGLEVAVLSPKGSIADQQKELMVVATLLMLIVVVPVYVMTFLFAWKFRASNRKAKYTPNWDHNRYIEALWWGIPSGIIAVLSVIIWVSSHQLDPFKPVVAENKPVTVQVVALQWKWLFIYPDHDIASINYVQFPEDTPVNFEITADAPMNSFWVPQLGGQVYAMSGMETKLHLIAHEPGVYNGVSANLSGERFADMTFKVESVTSQKFEEWVSRLKQEPNSLGEQQYETLAAPGVIDEQSTRYASVEPDLFDDIIHSYMNPETTTSTTSEEGH